MAYDPQPLVLDPVVLRRRAEQCVRLARGLREVDAAVLQALAREYEAEAEKLAARSRRRHPVLLDG